MLIFLHFFLWNLNNVFNSSSKIDLSISLGQKGIGNQMTEHAVINKPLYFVTSLCAVDACFYKLVSTLFHYRYTGEFYCLKWEKIAHTFSGLLYRGLCSEAMTSCPRLPVRQTPLIPGLGVGW